MPAELSAHAIDFIHCKGQRDHLFFYPENMPARLKRFVLPWNDFSFHSGFSIMFVGYAMNPRPPIDAQKVSQIANLAYHGRTRLLCTFHGSRMLQN